MFSTFVHLIISGRNVRSSFHGLIIDFRKTHGATVGVITLKTKQTNKQTKKR